MRLRGQLLARIANERRGPKQEQTPDIAVAQLADTPTVHLASGPVLPGREAEPGRKLPPRTERARIGHGGG